MIRKGAVVLVPFPFTDLRGAKIRPALVISHSTASDDVVLAFISSRKKKIFPHDVILRANAANGLKQDSVARCAKIATLERKIILGELGAITKQEQKNIDTELKHIFKLP